MKLTRENVKLIADLREIVDFNQADALMRQCTQATLAAIRDDRNHLWSEEAGDLLFDLCIDDDEY